jgi:hypothetical protein
MRLKAVTWINVVLFLLWFVSCTVAHSSMIECVNLCGHVTGLHVDTCPDGHAGFITMPAAPSVPQEPYDHDCCMCEHHAQCTGIVPGGYHNAGRVKRPTAPSVSSFAATGHGVCAAGTFICLPEQSIFASAARARLTCLRTTILRL